MFCFIEHSQRIYDSWVKFIRPPFSEWLSIKTTLDYSIVFLLLDSLRNIKKIEFKFCKRYRIKNTYRDKFTASWNLSTLHRIHGQIITYFDSKALKLLQVWRWKTRNYNKINNKLNKWLCNHRYRLKKQIILLLLKPIPFANREK